MSLLHSTIPLEHEGGSKGERERSAASTVCGGCRLLPFPLRTTTGTRQSALTLSDVYWRRICLRDISACSALEVVNFMRYINLLTYLLSAVWLHLEFLWVNTKIHLFWSQDQNHFLLSVSRHTHGIGLCGVTVERTLTTQKVGLGR